MHQLAQQLTNTIATDFCVSSIDLQKKVVHFTNGHAEPFEQLISTMPLDTLLTLAQEKSTTSFKRALNHLECNSVVNFNLGVARPTLSEKHWIYFPETQFPYYRLGFPHNFAESMAPAGCSSLYGEFAHLRGKPNTVGAKLTKALTATKKLLNIQPHGCVKHRSELRLLLWF